MPHIQLHMNARVRAMALPGLLFGLTAAATASGQVAPSTPAAAEASTPAPTPVMVPEAQVKADTQTNATRITDEVLGTTGPAFVALGVSSQTITSIDGLKRAAMGIVSGTDEDGKALQGIGVQFAPAQIFVPLRVKYDSYLHNYLARSFARLQINAAYARADASNGGTPERAALGATWVAFDSTDPFANVELDRCLTKHALHVSTTGPGSITDPEPSTEIREYEVTETANCRRLHVHTPTNGYSAQLGFAKLFRNSGGAQGALAAHGYAASGMVSIGLDCLFTDPCRNSVEQDGGAVKTRLGAKLLLGAVLRERELVVNPLDNTKFIDRNRQTFGGRLLAGKPDEFWFGLEMLYQRATYDGGIGRDNYATYSASLDYRLKSGLWFAGSYGNSSGTNFSKGPQFTAGLKFSFQPALSN